MDDDPRPLIAHLPAQRVAPSVFSTRAIINLFSLNISRPAPQPSE